MEEISMKDGELMHFKFGRMVRHQPCAHGDKGGLSLCLVEARWLPAVGQRQGEGGGHLVHREVPTTSAS